MVRRAIQLSSCSLDIARDPVRIPPRPYSLRHADYEDNFDFTTLFQDCFWDATNSRIMLIGPPLLNLADDLELKVVAHPSLSECEPEFLGSIWLTRAFVRVPPGTTSLVIRTRSSEYYLTPQPNMTHLFQGRRVITTLTKDNELTWIRDWAKFYIEYHGCTGVLLYDNGSTRYQIEDIYDCLSPFEHRIEVAVVSWPFKYGVADWRLANSYRLTDSLYCQPGMLEHARHRFLATAAAVLNVDIDELVITEHDDSLFDLVISSDTGQLIFGGNWIENYRPEAISTSLPRHKDYAYCRNANNIGCEAKWAAVPGRTPPEAQWLIHIVVGMRRSNEEQRIELRHFKGINTNWNVDQPRSTAMRTSAPRELDNTLLLDDRLRRILDKIFATEESEESEAAPVVGPDRRHSAYRLRDHAGKLAAAGHFELAADRVQIATSLIPEHPGFRLAQVNILQALGKDQAAQFTKQKAEQLQSKNAWYHFQRGRWHKDSGDFVEAQTSFERAIDLDPSLTPAYFQLAEIEVHRGHSTAATAILRRCVESAPRSIVAHATFARALEYVSADAIFHARTAIELGGETAQFFALHARLLRTAGEWEMAEREAAKGISRVKLSKSMDKVGKFSTETGFWLEYHWFEPVTAAAHDEMIEVLLHRGDLTTAESVAREALQLSPWWTNPDDFRRLAEILRARGFAEDAASLMQTALRRAEQDLQKPLQSTSSSIELAQERQWRIDRMARLLCGVGRQEDAIKVLYAGLDELPADPVLSYRLGSLLADGKMFSEAQRILRSALARWPESADLYFAMSKSQSDKDHPAVIDLVQRAVELAPRNSVFHDDLAAKLIAAGDYDLASRAIERALKQGCRSGPLYYRLSQVRKHYGDRNGALEAGRAAVNLEPQSAYLIDHLASLLLDTGEFAEAALIVKSAIERGLESSSLFYRWSLILQRLHQDEEAVAAASNAAARDPSQSYLKEHLANLLRGRGDLTEAEQILRTALTEHPEQAGLHYQLSRLLSDTKRPSEALEFAREAVRLSPERIYFHENLVNQLVAEQRYSEAEEGINYAIKKGLNSGQLMYRLSQLQARHDNLDGALHAAQAALRLEPTQAYLHEHLVGILFDNGRFDEAEAMVEQALQQGVESGALYYRRSRLLHRSDRKQEALLAASLAVSKDPDKTYLQDYYAAILKDVEQR